MSEATNVSPRRMPTFRVGDIVEVRSVEEILATLDAQGELENLPFMPEMLQYCGQRMVVHKVAHKLCDTISGSGLRWMNNAVHLKGVRCSGQSHGGCQTACSVYWKEAWLRRVPPDQPESTKPPTPVSSATVDVSVLDKATRKSPDTDGSERFSCQATELLRAAPIHIRFWNLDQYIADWRSGNVGLWAIVRTILVHLFNVYQDRSKRVLPACLTIREGLSWGFVKGLAEGKTPAGQLDLQVGEVVRIKPKEEIVRTIDARKLNRGMGFEEEMARSCGRTAKVISRVDRCIEERTGKMLSMKNPCIILENVICAGAYHGNCPREFLPFWREIWLERVNPASKSSDTES